MRTRNAIVIEALEEKYNHIVPGETIRVFCVSNEDYRKHRIRPRGASLPYLELSGIIGFRRFCVSLVSESQRRSALLYMRDRIPSLLAQLDLWVQANQGGVASVLSPVVRQILGTLSHRLEAVSTLTPFFQWYSNVVT